MQVVLDELIADFTVYPQLLVNVRVKERKPLEELPGVSGEIRACEAELNGTGRILVRYSGTEPKARLLLEGRDKAVLEKWSAKILEAVKKHVGA